MDARSASSDAASEAMSLLRNVARGAATCALPLPARQEPVEPWRGLGFSVGGDRLVSELGQVLEVLAPPRLTSIPGVRPWILGVANVRGRLLPVIDLCGYLGVETSAPKSQWRVLVVEDGELYCGLLVEQSFGMMQFEPQEAEEPEEMSLDPAIARFVRGGFRQSARPWRILDVRALVRERAFFDVAAL